MACGLGLGVVWLPEAVLAGQRAPSVSGPPNAKKLSSASAANPTLKSLTEVVNVPVTVRDDDQHLISNLTREDFSLAEDGRLQLIKYFSRTRDVPLTLGAIVDTTVCQDEALPLEKELAQDFIHQVMQPGDQGFVQHFDSGVGFLQRLTGDVKRLSEAIDQLQIEAHPASLPMLRPHGKFDRGPHHLYDAIAEASQELGKSQAGRKVLLLLTDGYEQDSRTTQKAALDAAERAGATIYCINMEDPILGMIPGVGTAGRPVLVKLTEQTGGRLFWLTQPRELPGAFNELARELGSQYFVGYTPTNSRHDGTYRRIRVTVKDKSWVVRARPGYYAPEN
ncbi:MAG TPA: VWA domain-containing protein [Terriglobia bacterium]|nr:VWA domain-containing protein [Terriglobia bacterium]